MEQGIIYLDHAAATPLDKRVLDVMQPFFGDYFFNPSSPYKQAVEVRKSFDAAKAEIAANIGVKPDELVMTAGATESINLAFLGVDGPSVVPTIEHQAVLSAAEVRGCTYIAPDERGFVSVDAVKREITDETMLVSVGLANNELGTIQPIREIADLIKQIRTERLRKGNSTPIYLHSDGSAGLGQLDIHVGRLGLDMLTLNAAKIYGPKQVGLLWAAPHVKLKPIIVGGGQERGLRSGTENVAGVIGFARALSLACEHRSGELQRLKLLRDYMQTKLTEVFSEAVVSGHPSKRLASHLHISFPGLDAERLIFALENRGVCVASGSACAANKGLRSHVLVAIDLAPEIADGSLRITLGRLNDATNIEVATEILIDEIKKEYVRLAK